MATIVDEAIEYVNLGWHVLPGIPNEKRPYTKWAEATNTVEGATKLFEKFPTAEILVLCGPSHLAVIDYDLYKANADDSPFMHPWTGWIAETPKGGKQYIYADPENKMPTTAGKLHRVVDTRGRGGLFVAPSVNSPKRRWVSRSGNPATWMPNAFPQLGTAAALAETHTDEHGEWEPVVGKRMPNEDCPGEYHVMSGRQPRLGIVVMPNGRVRAKCWSGCTDEEVIPLLIEAGRFTAEELGWDGANVIDDERPFITRDELMAIKPPVWMIDPYLQENALVMLAAKFNTGKTFVAVHWAMDLATSGRKVLYLALEGLTGLQSRIRAWEEYYDRTRANILFNPRGYVLDLGNDRRIDGLVSDIQAEGPFDLVVVDNLGEAVRGDENDSEVVGRAMYSLNRIRQASGGAVLTVHNSGHASTVRARGHSKMLDVHDTVIYLETVEGSIGGLKVISGKERNATRFISRRAQLVPSGDSLVAVMGARPIAEQNEYYRAVKEGYTTVQAIMAHLDRPLSTVQRSMSKLVESGDLTLMKMGTQNVYSTAWDIPLTEE